MANSLFVVQVFLPLDTGNLLWRLRKLILAVPEAADFDDKHQGYTAIVDALLGASDQFTVGNWDFTDDPDEAESEFENWCSGTERDAQEREAQPAGAGGSGPRSMFVTLAFLLPAEGESAQRAAAACDVPEGRLWKRATFVKLLELIKQLDFASVASDAVYLCPGEKQFGLTAEELRDESYDYLHEIV